MPYIAGVDGLAEATGGLQSGDKLPIDRGSSTFHVDADNILINKDTDELDEGVANLYFTNERVDDRFNSLFIAATGCDGTYNDGAGTYTLDVTLAGNSTQQLAESAASNHYVQPAGVSISNDQIKNLFTTPVPIPAMNVPAGRAYMLFVSIAKAHIDTTGYTNSGIDLVDTATNNILYTFPSSLIETAGDRVMQAAPVTTAVVITEANNVSVRARTSDPTGGNAANTLKVMVKYGLLDFTTVT